MDGQNSSFESIKKSKDEDQMTKESPGTKPGLFCHYTAVI